MYCTIVYDVACVHYIHVHVPGTIMLYNICILYCTMHSRGACDGYAIGLLHSCFFLFLFRKYRHMSYRQIVRWCWGFLGKYNRVPLPSCVMNVARTTYPDPDGEYVGFKHPPLND